MRSFVYLLLAVVLVSAAQSCQKNVKHMQLKEIIHEVNKMRKHLPANLKSTFVQHVFAGQSCNLETLCKAEKFLSKIKHKDYGLSDKKWMIVRQLMALKQNISCSVEHSGVKVPLLRLLEDIQHCGQTLLRTSTYSSHC